MLLLRCWLLAVPARGALSLFGAWSVVCGKVLATLMVLLLPRFVVLLPLHAQEVYESDVCQDIADAATRREKEAAKAAAAGK